MSFAEVLACASQWSSVLGFILGVVTVILAGTIKKAVTETERKAVFNMLAGDNIKKLKRFNREFVQNIDSKNSQVVNKCLSDLNTIIDIILRSAPSEFYSKGKKAVKQIRTQYKSYYYWEEKKGYNFFRKQITRNNMFDTYNKVNDFIDHLDNYIEEKNITR